MLWVPPLRVERDNVAAALEFNVEVPIAVPESRNVTVPLGVPGDPEVTVAVNVTDCLSVEGFREEVSAVVVFPFCTTWFSAGEVLGLKLASPL